ncbi:hypothetical protein Sjap_025567 [Stephania japonica]|uniref:Uncharacterized protein n=1 Tax=Stephania japonica TaxID=461633 RepID=A0AAP0HI26_9MAGN
MTQEGPRGTLCPPNAPPPPPLAGPPPRPPPSSPMGSGTLPAALQPPLWSPATPTSATSSRRSPYSSPHYRPRSAAAPPPGSHSFPGDQSTAARNPRQSSLPATASPETCLAERGALVPY